MAKKQSKHLDIYHSEQLQPKEELLAIKQKKSNFSIGVPKESTLQEKRVALVPSAAALLVNNGARVIIERGAGKAANFEDRLYSDHGAEIVDSAAEVYQADIILKVAPPSLSEIDLMKERQIIISALHIRAQQKAFYTALSKKRITAISYEHIRNGSNEHPVLHSISEIVGNTAILIGAEYLSHPKWGRGKMLGGFSGINPSEVVIIGAGTVGESAARAALGLGAMVKVFDNSISKLRQLQNNIGARIFTSIIQPDVISEALRTADVLIGAIYSKTGQGATIISEEMVKKMKSGSVIVDVSIDRGGCVETSKETSHNNPVYQVYDVTHYCVPNISSRTPHTASYALSNYFAPFLIDLANCGELNKKLLKDKGLRKGLYLYNGKITMQYIAKKYKLPYQDIELLLAAFG
ncbi:MAG: alanine dehydrogenase [Bacteroidetes bacterium]|nr:MAG: alanine dehydrogenase [Bacteroidota bacterium]